MNGFLADCVSFFHIGVVLFVLLGSFVNSPIVLFTHIMFGINLMLHWSSNNDLCSLTVLEGSLRGKPYTESFTYQFIGPVYKISKKDWSSVLYIVTFLLVCNSIISLYNSDKLKMFLECYSKKKEALLSNRNRKNDRITWAEWSVIINDCSDYLI